MTFGTVAPGRISLLAHSVQENVSPTYALPNAGGSVRRGDNMNASDLDDGYAREAAGFGNVMGESDGDTAGFGSGRGCWIERDGRESLYAVCQEVCSV